MWVSYRQTPPPQRRFAPVLALGMLPLIVFGMGFDLTPWYWAEDVGEMLGMSILLATVHTQYRRHQGGLL